MNQPLIDAYLDELLGPPTTEPAVATVVALVPECDPQAAPCPVAESPAIEAQCTEPARAATAEPPPNAAPAEDEPEQRATARIYELPASFAPVPPPQPVREPAPLPPALEPRGGARAVARPGRWLRVLVDEDRYAVELLRVQEVVRTAPIVAMRGADSAVLGVMNLRGRIVPVFDLGLWLGTTAVRPDERSRIVVVERDDELIGLLVTAVSDVATLGADHIEPPLGAAAPGAIVGVARANDAPTVLLDANWLFD